MGTSPEDTGQTQKGTHGDPMHTRIGSRQIHRHREQTVGPGLGERAGIRASRGQVSMCGNGTFWSWTGVGGQCP